ncbi:MAG: hypothetical protein KGJ02_03490 [Verrucomicrobiota bacterium]|nr:hypothetical protein [Verrucomicrobiota bacterium]
MNKQRIVAIVLGVVGAGLLLFSDYIANQVAAGRGEIRSAQSKVNMGKKIFSINPNTEQVGDTLMSPIQKRIDAGSEEADQYDRLSRQLKVGGILLLVVAGGLLFLRRRD